MYSKEYLLGTGYYLNNEYFDKYVELNLTRFAQIDSYYFEFYHHFAYLAFALLVIHFEFQS